jgi:LysR family nitrogen assimilation transcriptional regulator
MLAHAFTQAPDIDIKQVHYFLTLAKHGSISRAAQALGLAQPSLSEHIARLETRLNTKLAVRGPRGVTMTEAGRLLAGEGQVLVEAARALTDNIRELGRDIRGTVSIGMSPALSILAGVPLAETVRLEAPGIRLRLSEGLSGYILDWIEQEKIDLGFVFINPPNSVFKAEPIMEEEMFLVAAQDDVPVDADSNGDYVIDACRLADLPLVLPTAPHTARLAMDRFAQGAGIDLNVAVEVDSLSQIVEMVGRASAYSVLPHAPVAEAVAAGKLALVRIQNPSFFRTVYLTRKRSRPVLQSSLTVENIFVNIMRGMIDRYGLHARLIANPAMARASEANYA